MSKYIISDPKILSGMPIIRGTRVPVARIISLLKEGYTLMDIHKQFDHISLTILTGVLDELAITLNNTSYDAQILQT